MIAAFLGVFPAAGQYPRARPGEFEVRGFDIAPDGGWRTSARRVLLARGALLRSGAVASLNAPGPARLAVQGTFSIPVVPMAFRDVAGPYPASDYQSLFFAPVPNGRPWSVTSYYAAESRGLVTLQGEVFDWVRVDSTSAWYADGCNGIGVVAPCPVRARSRLADLLQAALDSISRGPGGDTVWNRFDNDGPDGIPNSGDDDGVVDLVAFLQPVVDGACGGDGIWAHRFRISGWNNGQPYITRTPRRGPNGQPIPGQYLTVDSYTLQSAVGGNTGCLAGQIMPVGTVAHETGHAFGLPDLYDTSPVSGTQGIGEWGLMGAGNYARPYSPASFDAWSLATLGWVRIDTLASSSTHLVGPVQSTGTVYLAETANPGVQLLLENRQAVGTDTAMMNPAFSRAKGPGVLVWMIDLDRIQSGLVTNTVNTGLRQGVELMQADGLNQLRSPVGTLNRGDAGDPYPGSTGKTAFGLSTLPSAVDWTGAPLDVRLDHFTAPGGGMAGFRFIRRLPSLVASRNPLGVVTVQGSVGTSWQEVLAPGDSVPITADSIQMTFDQRSALRFTGWSDGGARTHLLVARSGAPDTLYADFAAAHRLRITVSGPGSVAASAEGAVGSGVYLDEGTHVQLMATPAAGADFIGWRGDTTSALAALGLQMSAPIDLVARFVTHVDVDPAAAARALLGGPALTPDQRGYLDAVGNRNGSFDVGDLLAWLHRTGQQVPPALRRVRGETP